MSQLQEIADHFKAGEYRNREDFGDESLHSAEHAVGFLLRLVAQLTEERDAATEAAIEHAANHWFLQGGASQFGSLDAPENADALIAMILDVVRQHVEKIEYQLSEARAAHQGSREYVRTPREQKKYLKKLAREAARREPRP